jgi:hypothetical protein
MVVTLYLVLEILEHIFGKVTWSSSYNMFWIYSSSALFIENDLPVPAPPWTRKKVYRSFLLDTQIFP